MKKEIGRGAEAVIYLEKNVTKKRVQKNYRIAEIDIKLRKSRTKKEARILEKLKIINFPAPALIYTDKKEIIEMEYIKGLKLRDVLCLENHEVLMKELGKKIAVLHDNQIIHGDLTTSNFILSHEIVFIDFGLSFISNKIEDKAVDMHLLKQALESKHYQFSKSAFNAVINGYKNHKECREVLERLEKVEKRGRYKAKVSKH
ncbi:MAG: KEOPS complex kinase/ATPase Bud32 [Nanoarchaeota archaeon]